MDLWEWGSLDEVEWLIDSRNEAHHTANLWDWGSLDEVGWQILDPIVPLDRFERFQDLPIELQYEVYRHHFSTFLVFVSCCAPRECGNLGIHRHLRHLNTQFPDMSITKVSKQIHQDSMICFRRYALFGIFFLHRFVHDDNRCMLEPSELARKRERFEDDVKTFRHVLGPRYSCWVEGEYSNTFEFAHADSGLEFHSLQTIRAEHTIFRRPIDLTFDRYQIKELAKVVNGGIISIDLAIEIPIFQSGRVVEAKFRIINNKIDSFKPVKRKKDRKIIQKMLALLGFGDTSLDWELLSHRWVQEDFLVSW